MYIIDQIDYNLVLKKVFDNNHLVKRLINRYNQYVNNLFY